MSRHSKNNTANSVFTYGEKKMLQDVYGTIRGRIGQDSQKKFDSCFLCLQRVIDPLCCEKGHIFCKDCIYENLISQKKEKKIEIESWKSKEKSKEDEKLIQIASDERKKLDKFEKMECLIDTKFKSDLIKKTNDLFLRKENDDMVSKEEIIENLKKNKNFLGAENKADLIKENFWMAETKEGLKDRDQKKPSKALLCPADKKHKLKIKELYKVNMQEVEKEYVCHICKKELKFQKICMPRKCGHVMCKKCLENLCWPTERCGVCNEKLKKEEVINLIEGMTAFSAHNEVEAKKYTPGFMG